jgi:MFS family permease
MADTLRRRFPGGRIAVQMIGLLGAAPFVIWCGQTLSVRSLIISLTLWGFFKGMYDSNIFAAMLDAVPPKARGTAVGFMNMTGWLVGAGSAPVLVGYIAARSSLSFAISIAAIALVIASGLLLVAILGTARRDIEKVRVMSLSEASG